ncbi:BrxE family protein [Cupriavidus basilensis]|uniref:BrxE family protein n=1 Tax=Cupriavidus basilensis TaxID=68895 RepID=UPI00157B6F98|nr:BrxE family protein [Cupriavidus basilensis]NUA27440.1 BrxE family protein [Cupriavidus basilensis]
MTNVFESAAEIRVLVGYLAEQHATWFSSQFFGPPASAFLAPVFTRTAFQAQCNGVTTAAARVHDEAIGVGRTHHLFRLPEVLEQGVAAALAETTFVEQLRQHLTAPDAALARLEVLSAPGAASEGAQVMAGEFVDGAEALLRDIAGVYLDAFRKGIKTFPFVREA